LSGLKGEPRVVLVDDHLLDVPPTKHMLIIRNDDRPGVIGRVGSALGDAGVNISDMAVGRSPQGDSALMVVATGESVSGDVLTAVKAAEGVDDAVAIDRDA
ncbi:MAG: ACT domain-containing protein, partial [Acidimicrobiales bacterium]